MAKSKIEDLRAISQAIWVAMHFNLMPNFIPIWKVFRSTNFCDFSSPPRTFSRKSTRLLEYRVNLIDNANSRSCRRKSAIKDDRFGSLASFNPIEIYSILGFGGIHTYRLLGTCTMEIVGEDCGTELTMFAALRSYYPILSRQTRLLTYNQINAKIL